MTKERKPAGTPQALADQALDTVTGADKSSTWIRVSMNPGGAAPGDPDKPVIVGAVPNPK